MRCKKHLSDHTSTLGVCATCLRERLAAIIEAQTQAQAQLSRLHSRTSAPDEPNRKSDPNPPHPPPLIFPRSVSPYVSRRKSDDSTLHHLHRPDHQNHQQQHQHHHRIRFYSTPQVGPTYNTGASAPIEEPCKKSRGRFSLFSSLFRSRSDKFWLDSRASSLPATSTASASSTPSWFSAIFTGKRRNRSKQLYANESSGCPRPRGLSPDLTPDPYDDCDRSRSGSGDSATTTPEWKRTPVLAPSSTRRTRGGQGKGNVSGLAFCLSPLVRASPNRNWSQKGMPPEIAGEIRVAASFCKNRSRKLVDFGRANPNR